MTLTPNSQPASYLSATEFLKRCDARTVGDFCSDTGTRATTAELLNPSTAAGGNLQALLDDAAGMLESACLAGHRYEAADLASLDGVSHKLLYRILTDLTRGLMIERRPDKTVPIPPSFERAMQMLDKLRTGEAIFSFSETQSAGEMTDIQEAEKRVVDRNLSVTQLSRYFGRRGNRNPPSPSPQ